MTGAFCFLITRVHFALKAARIFPPLDSEEQASGNRHPKSADRARTRRAAIPTS